MRGLDWLQCPNDEDIPLDVTPNCISERMRQERVRNGLTVKALAGALGVHPSRVKALENGAGKPVSFDQLAVMAINGMDVAYVLTGQKTVPLRQDELALLENYRNSTSVGQASLREVGTAFAQQSEAMKKAADD